MCVLCLVFAQAHCMLLCRPVSVINTVHQCLYQFECSLMHTEAHNMQANYYYYDSTICNNMYGIIGTFDRVYEHYMCLLLYTELWCFVLAHIFVPTTETLILLYKLFIPRIGCKRERTIRNLCVVTYTDHIEYTTVCSICLSPPSCHFGFY